MIEPITRTGSRLPVVMVHGLFGVVPLASRMAAAFGTEHPFFVAHARAFSGDPHDSVESMARDYLAEFRSHCPRGPYIIAGMCAGALVALEMARLLRVAGETVPAVIMLEPNPVLNLNPPQRHLEPALERATLQQLKQAARTWFTSFGPALKDLPFDAVSAPGLEHCLDAGARLIFCYERHRVQPYSGQVDIIASEPFAKLITNASLPWRKEILLGGWSIHAVPGTHDDLFLQQRQALLATIRKVVGRIDEQHPVPA